MKDRWFKESFCCTLEHDSDIALSIHYKWQHLARDTENTGLLFWPYRSQGSTFALLPLKEWENKRCTGLRFAVCRGMNGQSLDLAFRSQYQSLVLSMGSRFPFDAASIIFRSNCQLFRPIVGTLIKLLTLTHCFSTQSHIVHIFVSSQLSTQLHHFIVNHSDQEQQIPGIKTNANVKNLVLPDGKQIPRTQGFQDGTEWFY